MNVSTSIVILLLLALVAANLPFVTERVLLLLPLPHWLGHDRKPFWLRLCECLFYYILIGLLAWWLEARSGNVQHQSWEFYAVTLCFFLVLAYPGFVWRYLKRHHPH